MILMIIAISILVVVVFSQDWEIRKLGKRQKVHEMIIDAHTEMINRCDTILKVSGSLHEHAQLLGRINNYNMLLLREALKKSIKDIDICDSYYYTTTKYPFLLPLVYDWINPDTTSMGEILNRFNSMDRSNDILGSIDTPEV